MPQAVRRWVAAGLLAASAVGAPAAQPEAGPGEAPTVTVPARGSVVPVTISAAASGFKHRGELVYLPPAWFATSPPPKLPTVLMLGGEFNTPADWLRAGSAGQLPYAGKDSPVSVSNASM